jgi:hypothetical protein
MYFFCFTDMQIKDTDSIEFPDILQDANELKTYVR